MIGIYQIKNIMTIRQYIEKEGLVNFEKILTVKGKEKVKYPNWIISDTRFPNELEAVKNRKGVCIKIERDFEQLYKDKGISIPANLIHSNHLSETALDSYKDWDLVIYNDNDLEQLIDNVRIFMFNFKIN